MAKANGKIALVTGSTTGLVARWRGGWVATAGGF